MLQGATAQLGMDLLAGGGLGSGDMYSRNRNEGVVKGAAEMGLVNHCVPHTSLMDEAVAWARKARFRQGANEVREIREG